MRPRKKLPGFTMGFYLDSIFFLLGFRKKCMCSQLGFYQETTRITKKTKISRILWDSKKNTKKEPGIPTKNVFWDSKFFHMGFHEIFWDSWDSGPKKQIW